jgi:HK97 family phage prohead protease
MKRHKFNWMRSEFDLKALDAEGKFSGYASVFNNIDRANEIVVPGAFAESIAALKAKGDTLPFCWQHDLSNPIGDIPVFEEDEKGLYVEGQLWLDESEKARMALRGMKTRSIRGMSFGYRVLGSEPDTMTGARRLTKLDIFEASAVTLACNPEAQVDAVKAGLIEGQLPSLKDFEGFLREAGFSKSQATVIAGRGLKSLIASESDQPTAPSPALAALHARLDGFLSL